jgi:hypothetical protein
MIKKIYNFIFVLLLLSGCASVSDTNIKNNRKLDFEVGPIFLPEDPSFKNISINYFTKNSSSTKVYFSMVENVDWIREEKDNSFSHKMIFSNLEEGARYKFYYFYSPGIKKEGSIRTVPYGKEFEFSFSLASIGKSFELKKDCAFLVLFSPESEVELSKFISFYKMNEKILSSTIIIPVFKILSFNSNYYIENSIFNKDFSYFFYKNIAIITITSKLSNYDELLYYIPTSEETKTYILIGNIGKEEVKKIYNKFYYLVEKFFVEEKSYIEEKKVERVNKGISISVSKAQKYALKLQEEMYE